MRTVLVILLILAALAVGYYLLTSRTPASGQRPVSMTLPIDLKELIPATWTVLPDQFRQCDFDGDNQPEWLVLYRYDQTTPTAASQASKSVSRGAIGGVIYDTQANQIPQNQSNPSPYRPGSLYPYRLLPDFFPGKGQGFLGETSVTVGFWPAFQNNSATCSVKEISIFGYSDSPLPTRLSIFRFGDANVGYLVANFVGNARLETTPDPSQSQQITLVRTYNRLNDRSQLCELREYPRTPPNTLNFPVDTNRSSIAFCFDAPQDPSYPEGVVMALLRGANPNSDGKNPTPTGNSYLTQSAANTLPPELNMLKDPARQPLRAVELQNPATLRAYPVAGKVVSDTLTNQYWVWGEEQIAVTTTVVLNGSNRNVAWDLVSLANQVKAADVHWRIDRVTLP